VKPPEPFTWFVDRSLGRKIVVDLRAAGFQVEEHSAHFADDAPDAEWLAAGGSFSPRTRQCAATRSNWPRFSPVEEVRPG